MTILIDRRNTGEEVELTELYTIPSSAPYYIRLTEVPLRYINTITAGVDTLKEQNGGTPLSRRFVVDYNNGRVDFNVTEAGKLITLIYLGRGSTIWAEDINETIEARGNFDSLDERLDSIMDDYGNLKGEFIVDIQESEVEVAQNPHAINFSDGFNVSVDVNPSGIATITPDESEIDHNLLLNTHDLTTDIDHNSITNTHNLTTDINHNSLTNYDSDKHIDHTLVSVLPSGILSGGGTINNNITISLVESDIDHNNITNTHNLTTDIDHTTITNIGSNSHLDIDSHIDDTTIHYPSGTIDHNSITNTHNLTTDIDHNSITNTHNLTTDIDHTTIQNIGTNSHTVIDSHIDDTTIHYPSGVIDHGALADLNADDHIQYHNDARGDDRYYTESESDSLLGGRTLDDTIIPASGQAYVWNDSKWIPNTISGGSKPYIFLNPGAATLPNDEFPVLEKVSGTNHVFWVAKFDCDGTNVKQDMYFSTMMPAGYGGGTLRITIYSRIEDSTPENSATIKVRVIGKAHDEVWDDGTGGEEVSITINPTATLWDLLIDYEDLSTTKPSAGEGLLIRVEHDLNQGSMTTGKDLQIIGIKIEEI